MEGDSGSCVVDIDDELGMAIGSAGVSLPSAGREGLNFEVCGRLVGGRDLDAEASSLVDGVAVEVAAHGFERGGMV